MLEMYKTLLAIGILGYAALSDHYTMTVPNKLWKFMLVFAIPFFLLEVIVFKDYARMMAANVLLVASFLISLYKKLHRPRMLLN